MDKLRIIGIGVLTLVLFPLLGFGLFWIIEGDYESLLYNFNSDYSIFLQLFIGVISGTAFGWVAWSLVQSNYMKPVLEKYGQVVKSLKLDLATIIFLSFCAGVGEEFFFRGVLQDYIGVVIAALIFVLIHGYLNPFDKIIFTYGLLMTGIIIAIGYMDIYIGLTASMASHMMIDVVLFYKLSKIDLLKRAEGNAISVAQSAENNLE